MRKIILLALCFLLALPSFAQTGIIWESGTLQEALNKAKTNKRGPNLVFLDCYTTWCGPCKHMANNVFPTKEAGDYFNKNFVNIKMDMEKGDGIELAKNYSVTAYPTFLILDANGEEIGRLLGGQELNGFIQRVEAAKELKNSPKYIKEAYDADKTPENALAYMKVLEASAMSEQMAVFITENLAVFKKNQIFSPQMWRYFSRCLNGAHPALLNYLLENKNSANALIGKDVVDKVILNAYNKSLTKYLFGSKNLTLKEVREAVRTMKLLAKEEDKLQLLIADLAVLYAEKNIEEICKLYNFNNLSSYNMPDIQSIERIFGAMKEIPERQMVQYYKNKADFYAQQIEECIKWKNLLIKNK